MKINSEIVEGIEFDVTLYDTDNGRKGIMHECLEDIIYNRMPKELGVTCDIHILTVTPTYCAVKCEISDVKGRKVYGFNDTNLEHLEKDDDFIKQHPLIKSVQSAMDIAIKTYLKWPRMYPGNGYATTEVSGDEGVVLPTELEENSVQEETTETTEFTGMNPPEDSDDQEKSAEKTDAKAEPNKNTGEDFSSYSIEELGAMKVKTGTYKDKTLDEMWEEMPSWFDFVLNKSQSTKYNNAREYVKRKKAE
ncbi:hypothetical protein [Hungatella hathewayi]|uniref:hypothetical protein n=1 Tax=Hungatella hathewayi TaxID=154046 RepID=UPI003567298F